MSYDFLMPPTLDEINEQSQKEKELKAKLREEMKQKELLNGTPEVADIES
jgi:Tfp pilus assembly protein PilO